MARRRPDANRIAGSETRRISARGPRIIWSSALALTLLVLPMAALAEVNFRASLDRDEMGLEDRLTMTVTVTMDMASGDYEDLKLPEATDFNVVSTQHSRQTSMAMANGPPTITQSRIFTVILSPRKTGVLSIKPGQLVLKRRTYLTNSLQVKVVPGKLGNSNSRPNQQQRMPSMFGPFGNLFGDEEDDAQDTRGEPQAPSSEGDLFVRTTLDKSQVYLGEQAVLSTYVFSRGPIVDLDDVKMPKLDGFWVEDLEAPRSLRPELKQMEGVTYHAYLLRKQVLFPLKSGKLTIEPLEMNITPGYRLLSAKKVHRASRPLTLEVLRLPPGAPSNFESTNIGSWKISAEATPTSVQLGQPVTLKIVLEGSGNLHDLVAPTLPPIPGVKSYEPTVTNKPAQSKGRFGGQRILEYLLMPEQSGKFTIPPLTVAYFDPETKQYEESSAKPIELHVEAGASGNGSANVSPNANGTDQRPANLINAGPLRPLRYKGELGQEKESLIYKNPLFVLATLVPFVLWLGFLTARLVRSAFSEDQETARQKGAGSRARKRLAGAKKFLQANQPDPFYAEISQAFYGFLADKLGNPVAGLTRVELSSTLLKRGFPGLLAKRLCDLLDTCDAGRFAPGGASQATWQRVFDDASSLMPELDSVELSDAATEEIREIGA